MLPTTQEIKTRRKRLSLTQSQLANEAGVSQSLIAKIESDNLDPSYSNTVKIFDALERIERKTVKTAEQIMSKTVEHVKKTDTVGKVLKLMKQKDFSQLPVFDESHPIGSISDKTILDNITEGTPVEELSEKKVEEVMSESFPIIAPETPLPAISSLLNYHFAVLVRKKGKVVGIITKADLLKLV
ncbi:CBS domain-containing protein [Candidatus Micrarchaeota archaeon]|nr:CBS domain-containing protein [Candidatus Micrarchaeota archaeon]